VPLTSLESSVFFFEKKHVQIEEVFRFSQALYQYNTEGHCNNFYLVRGFINHLHSFVCIFIKEKRMLPLTRRNSEFCSMHILFFLN